MAKASWNGTVIAQSDDIVVVEGTQYFPAESLNKDLVQESDHTSECGWKGTANYYHVVVDGQQNDNAAWYYANPKPEAQNIAGRIAFWKGVEVQE